MQKIDSRNDHDFVSRLSEDAYRITERVTTAVNKCSGAMDRESLDEASLASEVVSIYDLLGIWCFEALEVPAVGIRREIQDNMDYYLDFKDEKVVVAHINGETFDSLYILKDGNITFSHINIASLKLSFKENSLLMHNYLGTTIIFRKLKIG